MRLILILLLLICSPAVFCQETRPIASPGEERVIIEARVIEERPSAVHATGDVLFQQGRKRLLADEVFYNYRENTGRLTEVTFTTCELDDPDYKITASEVRLTPEQRLKLRRVRIYLFGLRVLSLPSLSINVGPGDDQKSFIPAPGYNSRDGFFLATSVPLVDTEETTAGLRIRLTTAEGIQGGVTGAHAFNGATGDVIRYTPDFDTELRRQALLRPFDDMPGPEPDSVASGHPCPDACLSPKSVFRDKGVPKQPFPETRTVPSSISAFGAALFRERAYDIDSADLLVTRLPEIGVRYVSPRVTVYDGDRFPRFGVQTDLRASWSRLKEIPNDAGYRNRLDIRGTASTTIATVGRFTALQGTALGRYSTYGSGDGYSVFGGALDLSRIFPGGSYASLRLIAHTTSGSTPFEFDDIDILRELQAAGRYVRGRNTYEALFQYDLDDSSLRDWELKYARRLDCIEPSISWRNRFDQISIGIRILGL